MAGPDPEVVNAVIAALREKFDLEQVRSLVKVVEGLKSEITDVTDEITGIKSKIVDLEDTTTWYKGEITGLKGEITGFAGGITGLKSEITGVAAEFKLVGFDKTLLEVFQDLKEQQRVANRFTNLEQNVAAFRRRVGNRFTNLERRVTTLRQSGASSQQAQQGLREEERRTRQAVNDLMRALRFTTPTTRQFRREIREIEDSLR